MGRNDYKSIGNWLNYYLIFLTYLIGVVTATWGEMDRTERANSEEVKNLRRRSKVSIDEGETLVKDEKTSFMLWSRLTKGSYVIQERICRQTGLLCSNKLEATGKERNMQQKG